MKNIEQVYLVIDLVETDGDLQIRYMTKKKLKKKK